MTTTDTRDLLNYAYSERRKLGRKFEPRDVLSDAKLFQAANAYLQRYDGSVEWANDFMLPVQQQYVGHLTSAGVAKGVLNVLWADAQNRLKAKTAAPAPATRLNIANVADGRFRVVLNENESVSVKIKTGVWKDEPTSRKLYVLIGSDNWLPVGKALADGSVRFWRAAASEESRVQRALDVLSKADDTLVYGLAYALEGSRCCFCGLNLDREESIKTGYGPDCAAQRNLPWGDKATPASVLVARIAQASESTQPKREAVQPVVSVAETTGDAPSKWDGVGPAWGTPERAAWVRAALELDAA